MLYTGAMFRSLSRWFNRVLERGSKPTAPGPSIVLRDGDGRTPAQKAMKDELEHEIETFQPPGF